MRLKHSFRTRDHALAAAVDKALNQGWSVLVLGTGFYFEAFERYVATALDLYAGEAVYIIQEQPYVSARFHGGGTIRFADLTPGQERGKAGLNSQVTADLIYVIEDDRGSLVSLLAHIVHPIMERSGDHCVLSMIGESDDPEFGQY